MFNALLLFLTLVYHSISTNYLNYIDTEFDMSILFQDKYNVSYLLFHEYEWTYETGFNTYTSLASIEDITFIYKTYDSYINYYEKNPDNFFSGYYTIDSSQSSSQTDTYNIPECLDTGICLQHNDILKTLPTSYMGSLFEVDYLDSVFSYHLAEVEVEKYSNEYNFNIDYRFGFYDPLTNTTNWVADLNYPIYMEADFNQKYTKDFENDYATGLVSFEILCKNFLCSLFPSFYFDISDKIKEDYKGELLQVEHYYAFSGDQLNYWNPYFNYMIMYYDTDACKVFDIDKGECTVCQEGYTLLDDPSVNPFCKLENGFALIEEPTVYKINTVNGIDSIVKKKTILKPESSFSSDCLLAMSNLKQSNFDKEHECDDNLNCHITYILNFQNKCEISMKIFQVDTNSDVATLIQLDLNDMNIYNEKIELGFNFNSNICTIFEDSPNALYTEGYYDLDDNQIHQSVLTTFCQVQIMFYDKNETALFASEFSMTKIQSLDSEPKKVEIQFYYLDEKNKNECLDSSCIITPPEDYKLTIENAYTYEILNLDELKGVYDFLITFEFNQKVHLLDLLIMSPYGITRNDDDFFIENGLGLDNSIQLYFSFWRGLDLVYYFIVEFELSDGTRTRDVIGFYGNLYDDYTFYDYESTNSTVTTTELTGEPYQSIKNEKYEMLHILVVISVGIFLNLIVIFTCLCIWIKARKSTKESEIEVLAMEQEYQRLRQDDKPFSQLHDDEQLKQNF